MTVVKVNRILCVLCLFLLIQICSAQYEIPDVKIQAFRPKGFKAFIPDAQNVSLFVFQGNLNRAIGSNDVGSISGEVTAASNGQWVFEDPNLQLNVGDVINYYVFVSLKGAGYLRDNLSYTVSKLDDKSEGPDAIQFPNRIPDIVTQSPVPSPPPGDCRPTPTTLGRGKACAGQILFEENFDTLREDVWQIEQYIPTTHTDYPFVSYQKHAVSVKDGYLHIRASLQQERPGHSNETIISGSLSLNDECTSPTELCSVTASGRYILPPVVAGRVVNTQFSFIYGIVEVRAKMPQGDWLYPEILLEPLQKKYGAQNLASGQIKIASARGNKELYLGNTDYGNKILYGGPLIDSRCPDALLSRKEPSDGRYWGDDFHIYSIRWAPERIILSVDGQEWGRIEPSASGLRTLIKDSCRNHQPSQQSGSSMAPFDQLFYLAFGIDAGGISEFMDGIYTEGNKPKPWNNQAAKARLSFFKELYAWYPTWNQPELVIDYVKVMAL